MHSKPLDLKKRTNLLNSARVVDPTVLHLCLIRQRAPKANWYFSFSNVQCCSRYESISALHRCFVTRVHDQSMPSTAG